MATRVVEGKKPYTGGKAISIDENKVISLNLRDENNLIIYDAGDDEIYVDLQLDDEITPTSAFPIGVNVGRVIVDNGWDKPGTIISAETTSGDNIKIFYADEGTLWIDNGTGTFKQIYFKSDVDALLLALRQYIDTELAKKQNGVTSATAPSNPIQGDLWYDTTNDELKVYDGSNWTGVGGGDVLVSDQANNIFTPGMKIWGGTQSDYQSLTPDSNTAYLILAGGGGGGGWQPGANTVAYYPLTTNGNDATSNHYDLTVGTGITFGANGAVFPNQAVGGLTGPNGLTVSSGSSFTISQWINLKKGTPGGTRVVEVYFDSSIQLANNAFYQDNSTLNHYIGDTWTPNSTFNENTWYNLIYTNNNNSVKVYLNGVQTDTGTFPSSLTSQGIIWGQNWGNNNGYAQGNMKDIIIEDKEWSAQDVADYFDQTKGDYGIS